MNGLEISVNDGRRNRKCLYVEKEAILCVQRRQGEEENERAFLEIRNCQVWQRRYLRGTEKVPVKCRGTRIRTRNFSTANWA